MPEESDKANPESGPDLQKDLLRQIRAKVEQQDAQAAPGQDLGSSLADLDAADSGKLALAKFIAFRKLALMILRVHGALILGLSITLALLLSFVFRLNPAFAFAGSLVAGLIFSVAISPIKELWNSALSNACQQVGLWKVSYSLSQEGARDPITEILSGKFPANAGPMLGLKVSQLQLLSARKGDLKTAVKYGEYLYRDSMGDKDSHSFQASTLGSTYVELGNYDRGFSLLGECLDELDQAARRDSPAYITGLLGMLYGAIELERIQESEKFLNRLAKAIEHSHATKNANPADRWVRDDLTNSYSIEQAFQLFYEARVKELKSDSKAEAEFVKALQIAKRNDIQSTVVLLYPDILTCFAMFKLRTGSFDEAHKLASEAASYYEARTENRALDYWKARLAAAYASFKKGEAMTREFEEGLRVLKDCVLELHPSVACAHLWLGESQAKDGDLEKARDNINQALRIRKQLFDENSRGVKEATSALALLPPV